MPSTRFSVGRGTLRCESVLDPMKDVLAYDIVKQVTILAQLAHEHAVDIGVGFGYTDTFLPVSGITNTNRVEAPCASAFDLGRTNLTIFLWLNSASNFNSRMSISLNGSLNSEIATLRLRHLPT